jgi:hypothetical protein
MNRITIHLQETGLRQEVRQTCKLQATYRYLAYIIL